MLSADYNNYEGNNNGNNSNITLNNNNNSNNNLILNVLRSNSTSASQISSQKTEEKKPSFMIKNGFGNTLKDMVSDMIDENRKNDENNLYLKARKLDILVVDDNEIDRLNLCKILTEDGHNCFQANDGYDAIEKLLIVESLNLNEKYEKFKSSTGEVLTFDAIILDLIMPNLDGPQCSRKLREIGYKGFILGLVNNPVSQVERKS